jgi:uncharacterized linocin/CFP29 family protein
MNNLHRELAPISEAAWASIEEEARRTFTVSVAGRRVTDVQDPAGLALAAVGTGHVLDIDAPADGMTGRLRHVQQLVELTVPFTLSRSAIDVVERGAQDPDWQPLKDAAKKIGYAEDRAIFEGYPAAGITGIRAATSNPALDLPADVHRYPDVTSEALTALRLAGVGGPYALVLSTGAYGAVSATSDYGYPIREQLERLVDGEILWAPAIDGAFVLSARGGDYALHLGQDTSIGYLSHDAASVELYLQESMTFIVYTPEAGVALRPPARTARGD